jgi:hypothetical protein
MRRFLAAAVLVLVALPALAVAPGTVAPPARPDGTSPSPSGREACVNAWLTARNLDPYGQPVGTRYGDRTPLHDPATGMERERLPYLLEKNPELQRACP